MSRIKFVPVMVTSFLALIVLFGGWILYRDYGLVRPLQQTLSATKQVESVSVNISGSNKQVDVKLKQVPDLQNTYHDIKKKVDDSISSNIAVKIGDHRSQELEMLYQSYQPILFSGIDNGNYTEMINSIEKKAKQDGISVVSVTMDRENLYIQLEKGDHYLYDVLPYRDQPSLQKQGVKTI